MAWNQPSGKLPRKMNGGESRTIRPMYVWVLLLAVVILGGIVCWFVLSGGGASGEGREAAKSTKIKTAEPTVRPKAAPEPAEPEVEAPKPVDPNARPTKVGEVLNGYVMLPSGRIHRQYGVVTNSIANRPKGAYHIFDFDCENEIACYLTVEPGDIVFGDVRYDGRFKAEFLESLKQPIVVYSNDSAEHAQLKRDVIAAKLKLKDAMDRGEDIEQIMTDTRKELQDLMLYKMNLETQYEKILKEECETEEDVDNLLKACNEMLEKKGISPMKFGPIVRQRLMKQKEQQ